MGKPFMSGYKTYDAAAAGYGSPRQWRNGFHVRMGFEEAQEEVRKTGRGAWGILGIVEGATWAEVKSAYRKMARENAPDFVIGALMKERPNATIEERERAAEAATEIMKGINAAYVVLERRYGK